MEYSTKRKIKKWFKSRWKLLLGSGLFLLTGGTVMLVGFSVTGWSIIKWLQSPFAVTTFVFVICGLFLFIMALLFKKQQDLLK